MNNRGSYLEWRDHADIAVRRFVFNITHPTKPKTFKQWVVVGCLVPVIALMSVCIAGVLFFGVDGSGGNGLAYDAHYTACGFIKQRYPGVERIAKYRDSVVEQDGNIYRVAAMVDGKNAFGGPIRNVVWVEMEYAGTTWRLREIRQR